MSQDSWEDSVWAQDEPSPPESDGADGDHRGDEVQDQAGDLDDAPEAMCSAAGAVDEPGGGGFVDRGPLNEMQAMVQSGAAGKALLCGLVAGTCYHAQLQGAGKPAQ